MPDQPGGSAVRILLLEPPLFDARAPHLACASLAASLRSRGFDVLVRDLNVEAVLWLLDQARLAGAWARVAAAREHLFRSLSLDRTGGGHLSPGDTHLLLRYLRASRCGADIPAAVARALHTLRDPDLFYEPREHRAARTTIDAALDLTALACDRELLLGLCPQVYSGRYRATSLSDLIRAANDRQADVFGSFWEEEVLPQTLALRPLLTGISISNVFQVVPGLTLSKQLHDLGMTTVVGGPFFSKFASQLARLPAFFDLCSVVAIGEGEIVLPSLIENLRSGGDLGRTPNIVLRRGSGVEVTRRWRPAELVSADISDFRDLPLGDYLIPEPVLPIMAGKGCGWGRCTFCEIPAADRAGARRRRIRNPSMVAAEMKAQIRRHGARHFIFTDESLEPWLLEGIADAIQEQEIEVGFIGYARFSDAFDTRLCAKLAKAGCRKLLFGLESGSRSVNQACRKGVDLDAVPAVVEACQGAGIAVHVFSIIGLPGEGREEAEESAAYLSRLAGTLDLPASTLDTTPFYLSWGSDLRRNASRWRISYGSDQDFPLHVDDYHLAHGMERREATAVADAVHQRLCWESSEPGFNIGYLNPLWPGWEEYTALYLSRYPRHEDRAAFSWPRTQAELARKMVRPARQLTFGHLPFSLQAIAHGTLEGPDTILASAPSASLAVASPAAVDLLSQSREMSMDALARGLCTDPASAEDRLDALASAIGLVHAGILEW